MTYLLESALTSPVLGYTHRKSFRWQTTELKFYDYKIDIYCFSKINYETIAIELKLDRWQRAFEQALFYQLCADYSYIAVPSTTIPKIDIDLLNSHGVGLIAVYESGRCRQILNAYKSEVLRNHYREYYIDFMVKGVS